MSARKVDLLLPLLVVVIAGGAVALVVGLTGTSATEPGPPTPFEQEDPPAKVNTSGKNIPTMLTVGEPEIAPERMPAHQPPFPCPSKNIEQTTPIDPEIQQKLDEWKNRKTPWSQNE